MGDKALVDQTEVIISELGSTYVLEEKTLMHSQLFTVLGQLICSFSETMSKLAADSGLSMSDKDLASVMLLPENCFKRMSQLDLLKFKIKLLQKRSHRRSFKYNEVCWN